MSNKENPFLFPFPSDDDKEKPSADPQPEVLPPFSETKQTAPMTIPSSSTALTADEMKDIRKFLSLFGPGWLSRVDPISMADLADEARKATSSHFPAPPVKCEDVAEKLLCAWDALPIKPSEQEIKSSFKKILTEISPTQELERIFIAVAGIFPIQESLRHGTPEQKLFTLFALTDRFLSMIAGIAIANRKPLIKIVARYASEISESFTFLTGENDQFNSQYYERVDGANTSGRIIKEIRGFLVVRKNTEQVVRLGRALT